MRINRLSISTIGLTLFVVMCLLFTPAAHADVLFDNYNNSYLAPGDPDWGCEVLGPDAPCGVPHKQAMKFTISTGGLYDGFYLQAVAIPLGLRNSWACLPDPNTTVWVIVYSDVNNAPGAPLDTALVTASSTDPVVVTASYGGSTVLDDGTPYWVVVSGNGDSNHAWSYPDPPIDTGSRKHLYNTGYLWQTGDNDAALRVEGIPTGPLPVQTSTWGRVKSLFR
jgi:hypothetical protein